jgi:putative SOS response-associated peptidase YedK
MNYFNWGLIPSWAKDPSIGNCMINARAETVSDKPVFRGPFKNSRCLITADGFFEWKKSGSSKQPYFIRMKSKEPFGFAGLWSHWMSPDGSEIKSCSIITTSSNSLMRTIHDRTPVIMDKTNEDEWLDTKVFNKNHLLDMLKPCDIDLLEIYPISTYVNSPSNNSQQCIERIVKN